MRRMAAAVLVTGASLATVTALGTAPVGAAVSGPLCTGVSWVDAGSATAFAVRSDGTAWGFGSNSRGQLANNGPNADRTTPIAVDALAGVAAISGGSSFTVARFPSGTVKAAGYNAYGQLGNATTTDSRVLVATGITDATAIAAGGNHSLALRADGTVLAWGRNIEGQLGDGTNVNRNAPVAVSGLTNVVAVAAGWAHSLAIRSDGTVWAWGLNSDGQLGNGTKVDSAVPVQVSGLTTATAIDAGTNFSIALLADGTLRSWGGGTTGQLGIPGNAGKLTPVKITSLSGVTRIATGSFHTIATTNDGRTWAWGANSNGQLGNGKTTTSYTPIEVPGAKGASAVGAAGTSSYAVRASGTLWTWGANKSGQLGIGSTTNSTVPVQSGCPNSATLPWMLTLVADQATTTPGTAVTLTAIANQDVAQTPYAIQIFDQQTGVPVASCATGSSCTGIVTSPTVAVRQYAAYVATPSATGPPPFAQASAMAEVTWGLADSGPYSGSCTAPTQTVLDQDVGTDGHVLLQVQQVSTDETWVCFRINDSTSYKGGRLSVVAPSVGAPATTVDNDSAACSNTWPNAAPGPHPLATGVLTSPSPPAADTPYLVDTYARGLQAWVCLSVGTTHERVMVSGSSVPPAVLIGLDPQ
jgi:alpha-tubulin suppressor-like RCC1 family protein